MLLFVCSVCSVSVCVCALHVCVCYSSEVLSVRISFCVLLCTDSLELDSDLVPPSSAEVNKDEVKNYKFHLSLFPYLLLQVFPSNQGQLRESLVLELHGISTPSNLHLFYSQDLFKLSTCR